MIAVCNFAPVLRPDYKIGVPRAGTYTEVLNSDEERFGGAGVLNGKVRARKAPMHGFEHFIELKVPPMSTLLLKAPAQRAPKADKAPASKGAKAAAKKPAAGKTVKRPAAKKPATTGKKAK